MRRIMFGELTPSSTIMRFLPRERAGALLRQFEQTADSAAGVPIHGALLWPKQTPISMRCFSTSNLPGQGGMEVIPVSPSAARNYLLSCCSSSEDPNDVRRR